MEEKAFKLGSEDQGDPEQMRMGIRARTGMVGGVGGTIEGTFALPE